MLRSEERVSQERLTDKKITEGLSIAPHFIKSYSISVLHSGSFLIPVYSLLQDIRPL